MLGKQENPINRCKEESLLNIEVQGLLCLAERAAGELEWELDCQWGWGAPDLVFCLALSSPPLPPCEGGSGKGVKRGAHRERCSLSHAHVHAHAHARGAIASHCTTAKSCCLSYNSDRPIFALKK